MSESIQSNPEQNWRKKTIDELTKILEEKSQEFELLDWQVLAMKKISPAEVCQMSDSMYHKHVASGLDCLTRIEPLWRDILEIRTIIRKRVAINNRLNELSPHGAIRVRRRAA